MIFPVKCLDCGEIYPETKECCPKCGATDVHHPMPDLVTEKTVTETNRDPQKLLDYLAAGEALKQLSNEELVAKVLDTNHADNSLVEEMMNRIDPNWAQQPDGQPLKLTQEPT